MSLLPPRRPDIYRQAPDWVVLLALGVILAAALLIGVVTR
jgi:hypothetical protein